MSEEQTDPFNLLTAPWIPVRSIGEPGVRLVGLREALVRAREFTGVEDASPLQTVALYRLLLAVLHRALMGPQGAKQVKDWWQGGFLQEALDAYFERYGQRFELFGPQPFMQVADLPLEGFQQSWERLGAEVGGGNTSPLFNMAHRRGYAPFAQDAGAAARRLIEHQTFALGGLTRKFTSAASGAPSATSALVMARGANLHETLCLNLVPYTQGVDKDVPPWEAAPLTVEAMRGFYPNGGKEKLPQPIRGVVQGYVWQGRAVRLIREEDGRVTHVAYAEGVPPRAVDGWQDPMTALRMLKDRTLYPLKLSAERLFWRDFSAVVPDAAREKTVNDQTGQVKVREGVPPPVLAHAAELYRRLDREDQPVPMQVFGQINDQGKIELWRSESYDLPVGAQGEELYEQVVNALTLAQDTRDALSHALRGLASRLLSAGGRNADKDDISKLARSLGGERAYWTALEPPFRAFLLALPNDTQGALDDWRLELVRIARDAWALAGQSAGDEARALRATYESEGYLMKHLNELRKEVARRGAA